jgi:hypothetical protein
MRPSNVVEAHVFPEHLPQMPLAQDQQVIETFLTEGAEDRRLIR